LPAFDFMDENGDPRRRRHPRFGKRGTATLRRAVSEPACTGSLFDLSLGGCLIWLDAPLPFNPADLLEIKLETESLSLRLMGSMRYTEEDGRLLGMEFQPLLTRECADLEAFLVTLEAAAANQDEPLSPVEAK
jgi:hypothetical protein